VIVSGPDLGYTSSDVGTPTIPYFSDTVSAGAAEIRDVSIDEALDRWLASATERDALKAVREETQHAGPPAECAPEFGAGHEPNEIDGRGQNDSQRNLSTLAAQPGEACYWALSR